MLEAFYAYKVNLFSLDKRSFCCLKIICYVTIILISSWTSSKVPAEQVDTKVWSSLALRKAGAVDIYFTFY